MLFFNAFNFTIKFVNKLDINENSECIYGLKNNFIIEIKISRISLLNNDYN